MVDAEKRGIIWLVSYPKSGNTWLRIFLTNYQLDTHEPAHINKLAGGPIASARGVFDELAGVEASDLTPDEIERYRPSVYNQIAQNLEVPLFLKVHDAFTRNQDGVDLFPRTATQAVIYLIRNPLDVVVSFAHHANCTISEMIDRMGNPDNAFCDNNYRLHNQLRQKLLTWSDHVRSWVDESKLPVQIFRYEDMVINAVPTFTNIVKAAGLVFNPLKLSQALDNSSFDRLQEMERKDGFKERSPNADTFFRKGSVGDWKNVLTKEQVNQVISTHYDIMSRFGYLAENDLPVF